MESQKLGGQVQRLVAFHVVPVLVVALGMQVSVVVASAVFDLGMMASVV